MEIINIILFLASFYCDYETRKMIKRCNKYLYDTVNLRAKYIVCGLKYHNYDINDVYVGLHWRESYVWFQYHKNLLEARVAAIRMNISSYSNEDGCEILSRYKTDNSLENLDGKKLIEIEEYIDKNLKDICNKNHIENKFFKAIIIHKR